MMRCLRPFTLFALSWLQLCAGEQDPVAAPSVQVKNGTITGRVLDRPWNQDVFLGIPYAQAPIAQLRFRRPKELNSSFETPHNASNYGPTCFQHPNALTDPDLAQSEDCLSLNVIRPHGINLTESLPVLVWIYGGGFFSGSSADAKYNLSGIVRTAQDGGRPILAVSLNYRVGPLGFFQSPQTFAESDSNAGLLDQRLALRWLRENIAAFGGDPSRITIWGESSGSQSISLHLHSYNGRNDGLFSSAIMESGGTAGTPLLPQSYYVAPVQSLSEETGCGNATDQLECLRSVSVQDLYATKASSLYWNPIVDGDFLTDYPSALANAKAAINIPLLIGTNSDEGISFSPRPSGPSSQPALNSSKDIFNSLMTNPGFAGLQGLPYQLSPASARTLLELYPDTPSAEPPYDVTNDTVFEQYGLQWRRSCAIYGDLVMVGTRRRLCEEYNRLGQPVFSYRFATRPWNAQEADGVGHFVNVAYSFQNISGTLGPLPTYQSHYNLSRSIGRSYINFVYDHDPNGPGGSLASGLPVWEQWTSDNPVNMVLNATRSELEQDVYRQEGITFINSINRELLG